MKALLFTLLFLFTLGAQAQTRPLYSDRDVQVVKDQISKTSLMKLKKTGGVDAANEQFFKVVTEFAQKAKGLEIDDKGLKLQNKNDVELLVYIVNMAQYFTLNIDQGLIHYYGLSQLYKVIPKDMSQAIENSALSASEKMMMRQALKAQSGAQ